MALNRARFGEFKPWAGLLAGMAGAGLQHQGISDSLHFDCHYGNANLVVGLAALVLIAIGAWLSWLALRAHRDPESARRFVAIVSLMAAVFFAIMVGWQIMAGLILPACLP
jgi:glucose uptake protein GlcU